MEGGKSLAGPSPHSVALKQRGRVHLEPSRLTSEQFLRAAGSDVPCLGAASPHGTLGGLILSVGQAWGLAAGGRAWG